MSETSDLLSLIHGLGNQWLSVTFIVGWFVYKSGLVQRHFGHESAERHQLSEDQQLLVTNLQTAVQRLDLRLSEERAECARGHAAERADCERRIVELHADCDRQLDSLRSEVSALVRGESRWRHLTGNLAVYVAALQAQLRKVGVEVPRFGGWDQFIADGGDPLLPLDPLSPPRS